MNLMIDLETLGTESDCPVISIGACVFDKTEIKDTFYITLNVEDQIDAGRRPSGATIKWWMQQDQAAQKVFKEDAIDTKIGLQMFIDFIKSQVTVSKVKPWGNGSNFDISIIENLLKMYNLEVPWNFYNVRDLRTFKEDVYDGKLTIREGTHHNALDDAIYQAQIVIDGRNKKDFSTEKIQKVGSFRRR